MTNDVRFLTTPQMMIKGQSFVGPEWGFIEYESLSGTAEKFVFGVANISVAVIGKLYGHCTCEDFHHFIEWEAAC